MKILWIYPELPYPIQSGYLRGFNLLRELGKRHEVTFFCMTAQSHVPAETIHELRRHAKHVQIFTTGYCSEQDRVTVAWGLPFVGHRLRERIGVRATVRRLRDAVRHAIAQEHFDVILLESREATSVVEGMDIPVVVDCGDSNCARIARQIHYVSWRRKFRLFIHYLRTRRAELRLARLSPYRAFISERDRANLLGRDDRSEIIPQGIDQEFWTRTAPPTDNKCIVFSGVMSYPPNEDAVLFLIRRILPLVRKQIPEIELLVVGKDPSPHLLDVARLDTSVKVTGAVPDVRPYLERACVYVAPLRFASGVQNKVLEALAMRVPVVTTRIVADGLTMNGVPAPAIVADDEKPIADSIVALLSDRSARTNLAARGREFIEKNCSWAKSTDKLEELCAAAVKNSREARQRPGKPHIVHLSGPYPANDIRISRKMCRSEREAGYRVTQFVHGDGVSDDDLEGIETRILRPRYKNRLARVLLGSLQTFLTARGERADIYHVHHPDLMLSALLLKATGAKVIYDPCESFPDKMLTMQWIPAPLRRLFSSAYARFERTVSRAWDHIIVADQHSARLFNNRAVSVVPNYPVIAPIPNRTRSSGEKSSLLYVGGISEERGLGVMLRVADLLQDRAELHLVGWCADEQDKRRIFAARNVHYFGVQSLTAVYKHMVSADVGLLLLQPVPAYAYAGENTNKLFEYMQCGLPVISSDFPNLRAIVEPAECGVCVDPTNPDAIAKAISDLLEDPNRRRDMGQNGRDSVQEQYNWQNASKVLMQVYSNVLYGEVMHVESLQRWHASGKAIAENGVERTA